MTNEEAIKNLKKLKSFHNGSYGTAINLAIKALEQQPSEPRTNLAETSQDCISREAVIQIIENKLNPCTDMFKCLEMSEIKEDVEHLPSVTPQRPKGKWIHKMQVMSNPYTEQCSVCKEWQKDKTKYCPNCGSYNGGEEECNSTVEKSED